MCGDGVGRSCWDVVGSMEGATGLPCRHGCTTELFSGEAGASAYSRFTLDGTDQELYCMPMGPLAVCVFGRNGRHAASGVMTPVSPEPPPPMRVHRASVRVQDAAVTIHTFAATQPLETEEAIGAFYRGIARRLAEHGEPLFHEKVFGELDGVAATGAARAVALSDVGIDPKLPFSYVGQRPCIGGLVAGVQVWPTAHGACETVHLDGAPVGRLLETAGLRMMMLTGVTGPFVDAPEQASGMFTGANDLLAAHGFRFQDVTRTWIYIDRLLEWYDDFNVSRRNFFEAVGIMRPDRPFDPPASTGIQGGHPLGAECFMDVLAIASRDEDLGPPFRVLRTDRQNEAYEYGSAFSRGMTVGGRPDRMILVSGTASIDTEGNTIYIDDPQGQLIESYADAAAVLQDAGAGLGDVVSAVLFSKNEVTWRAHQRLVELGLIPRLPAIATYADVCRDDLLFELEVTGLCRGEQP